MLSCVCEGSIDDDCDLGICRSLERPVHVMSPIIKTESLLFIKLQVLTQKYQQSLFVCCLWWNRVLSYILLLLKASHMAEKNKFASHRSVLSKVFFCYLRFYSIRIISFLSLFSWKHFIKPQLCRNCLCHPSVASLPMSTASGWADTLCMAGVGKDTLQVWQGESGRALFMGEKKKSKQWEISSRVFCWDQHIVVHLGQITLAVSLFRAEKILFS